MLDKVEIYTRSGGGGNGVASFRREAHVPYGGPDGGDGGKGGAVVLVADLGRGTLSDFRHRRRFVAEHGRHGAGKKKHGRDGEDLLVKVPVGTLVWAIDGEKTLLVDLAREGDRVVVARGGRGGWGNVRFTTPTNQAPRYAQKGEPGEERRLFLELKLLADVGIVGYPNVGKSTLLRAISAAHPKVGDYPFTTTEPVLGVVELGYRAFVVADIPGLIEGAHLGKGLGHDFLAHIERTKVLIHLLDGTSRDVADDFHRLNRELELFKTSLLEKPQLVAVNKLDVAEVRERREELQQQLAGLKRPLFFVSAATGEGVKGLLQKVAATLESLAAPAEPAPSAEFKVFQPKPRGPRFHVSVENGLFVVSGATPERLAVMTDMENREARQEFRRQLARLGVARALEKAGIQPGNRVRLGKTELEWE